MVLHLLPLTSVERFVVSWFTLFPVVALQTLVTWCGQGLCSLLLFRADHLHPAPGTP